MFLHCIVRTWRNDYYYLVTNNNNCNTNFYFMNEYRNVYFVNQSFQFRNLGYKQWKKGWNGAPAGNWEDCVARQSSKEAKWVDDSNTFAGYDHQWKTFCVQSTNKASREMSWGTLRSLWPKKRWNPLPHLQYDSPRSEW